MWKNELFSLSVLTISILCILVILLLYLIIRKALDKRNRKKIENYKENYNPLIYRMLTEHIYSRKLTPETSLQQKAFEELLSRYLKVLESAEEIERLAELAALYLTEYYRKRLKSLKWSTRMNTLYHIEDFNMISLLDDVYALTKRKRLSHEELVHILRILSLFQFKPILQLLTTKYQYLAEYDYRHILLHLNKNQFDQFVLYFHKAELPLQKAVLEVISIKKNLSYLPFVENIISSFSGEIKLRALKAVAQIGYVKNINPYLDLLYSTKWEERLVAAKLVGSLKEEKAMSRLIELLHDRTWWVRSQAGQSISQFANGKDVLRKVLETSKDAFAKDMAWEWLHKGV
ncbi:HEAT repeat domain-containing protein [Bacillus salipaludis]|uniref:HEAT repeat domain-containing protein n=1 Tax=Bacillus salipaludis TaxID=2547811 RepID=A0ABW8RKT2_9BACI